MTRPARPVIHEMGSATVELALVLPVVMLVLIASVEVVSLARTQIELAGAAREGARVAATVPDPSQAASAARAALSPPLADRTRVTVRRPTEVGATAEVVVSVSHRLLGALLGGLPVELHARAAMRVER
ncbi:MAG TPA: TadE family type IV pilus minor pilin [Acidimicrobiia bacterium]|jgi:Flp pilus assembly protein TadG|nr:TadE family type IV pilus minor pilin [Acidimicrobiia bacterium]